MSEEFEEFDEDIDQSEEISIEEYKEIIESVDQFEELAPKEENNTES